MTLAGAGAIITAGASGLGAATVRALQGEALAAELGERVRFVAADVTDAEGLGDAVERAAQAPQGLRISVACAGVAVGEKTAGRDGPHALQSFQRVVEVNVVGAVQPAAPRRGRPEWRLFRQAGVATGLLQ